MNQVRCFVIHPDDNVGTLLDDAGPGPVRLLGSAKEAEIIVAEPVQLGHKIAIRDLRPGEPVVKYGVTIACATRGIARGTWVHLHNCRSGFDERSQTLDAHTGATTDTRYE